MEYDGSTANINSDIEYFDSNNQPISAEEFYTQEIYDPSGNVAHTYLHYNQTVSVIEYRWEGEELILSTISQFAYNSAVQMHQRINFLFGSLYFVEFGIMCILYIKKKRSL
ncbi:MAG: hypothetical protein IJ315_07130 [Firmicutes bacterium]|nr:hypothetical protein [Bacillota bacterium]